MRSTAMTAPPLERELRSSPAAAGTDVPWAPGWYILPGVAVGLLGWYGVYEGVAWIARSLVPG